MMQDVGMLYSPLVTFCTVIITFYQRTLLGVSANQKRHYLKSYNNNVCLIPVKTDVGQVDLLSWLSDGTSEKMTVLPFEGYFL